ncbi:hypothetical protein ACFSTH_11665 [Paenibacillus yanchengensis]|uniref:Uncharacterized protein n=1 Tax=Paenibacillus yanchengensis TaxID=2035833 RepID=A0ABW4YRH2_9BACL
MIPATVEIHIDQDVIKEYIQQELQKYVHQQLLLVDIRKLAELTSMSVDHLNETILHDPRVKMYERKKRNKRWWLAQPTFDAIVEVVNEW